MVQINILLVEDNPADQELTLRAIEKTAPNTTLTILDNGEKALHYLTHEKEFKNTHHTHPDLILLDINLPRKSGDQVLEFLKQHPDLKHIPVVILTTSNSQQEIKKLYNLGASSYIVKPLSFDQFTQSIEKLSKYWFETVELPK